VHAARVLGYVTADGAGNLARRIGGVIKTEGRGEFGDHRVAHAGLHHRHAGERIDAQHAHELGHRQQYAVAWRQRAAG
jgi:hypothetical protein